jgi:hypothetical protein
MEDPVSFDIWAKVPPHNREVAVRGLTSLRPELKRIEVRTLVNQSVANDEAILVAEGRGWDFVHTFKKLSSGWVDEILVYQHGWKPGRPTNYCPTNRLNYGGCLGCHVCNGFFVR